MKNFALHKSRSTPKTEPGGPLVSTLAGCAIAAALLWATPVMAKFEKIEDLESVSVSHDASFQAREGRNLLRTWIMLDYKEGQNFDPGIASLQPGNPLTYRSRKDYVQVDCKKNLYAELATQMFTDGQGKGAPVFESTYLRAALPRFVNPSNHEGAVLSFLCKGGKPN